MRSVVCLATCLLLLFDSVASAAIQRPLKLVREWEAMDTRYHSAADIDGDGNRELIVLSLSGRDVLVLRADGSARGYAVLGRIAGASPDRVAWLQAVDAGGDASPELVISWTGGRLVVVDGASLRVRAERRMIGGTSGASVGDFDGDGTSEMLVRSGGNLLVLSPATLQTLASFPSPAASSGFRVGDVHGDTRPELVAADGVAYSITRNGQNYSATSVWTSARGPLAYFALADLDGDGKSEAVSARLDGSVGVERISPSPAYVPLAQYPINYGITLEDLTGDGVPEALVSCGCTPDNLVALTMQGGELWRVRELHLGGASVLKRSTGELSLVLGDDWRIKARPLPGASGASWEIGKTNLNLVSGSTFYDDAGQSRMAILIAPSSAGHRVGVLDLWDAGQRDVGGSGPAWLPTAPSPQEQAYAAQVVAIDRPDRPQDVLALVGSYTADWVNGAPIEPRIWIMDRNATLVRERTVSSTLSVLRAVRWHGAGEGQPRVAIAGRVNANTVRLQTIGIDDGAVAWQSDLLALDNGLSVPLESADLDGDGSEELIAQVGSNLLVFAPGAGTAPVRVHADVTAASVLPALVPAGAQLLLARADGSVSVHQGLAAAPSGQITLGYATYSIAAFRDPESGEPLLATTGVRVHLLSNGEQVAAAPGYDGRLMVRDIDGDGRAEIVVTDNGHAVLRLGSAQIIHDSGFE